jgi:hypothetical protein
MSDPRMSSDTESRKSAEISAISGDDVEMWPSLDDTAVWFFLPGPLGPERSPGGVPTLSLLELGQSAILQCGAIWQADPAALSRLIAEAAKRASLPDVRLSPAAASVKAARLEMIARDGGVKTLQETTSSNIPPYTAIFHVPLTAESLGLVKDALDGKEGVLSIHYVIEVQRRARVSVQISGTLDRSVLPDRCSKEEAATLVAAAVAAEQLQIAERTEGPAPEGLCAEAREGAVARAAAMLASPIGDGQPSDGPSTAPRSPIPWPVIIDVTVSLASIITDEITRSTDLATWRRGGWKQPAIGPGAPAVPTSGPQASDISSAGLLTVDRSLAGAPVAFVEARGPASTAVLRGPDFAAAIFAAPVGSSIRIVSRYTDGGPAYESEIVWAGGAGFALGPADLGLARVTIDASGRKAAGAQSLAAKVTYSPSGSGTPDCHESRFRYGDWCDSWFVVTRDKGLSGELAVEWRETDQDGSETKHPRESRQEPNIVL